METVLKLTDVTKHYNNITAVDDISFEVKRGEIFGLIGPDGAGKSTLINIAGGLLNVKEGRVTLLQNDMLKYPERIRSSVGIIPQGLGLSLAGELSVEENINFFAEINGVDNEKREKRKEKLLSVTRLTDFKDRPAKNLSGGMKQKLGICCTLIHSPEMIFLDEPTTGVDPVSRRDIWYLINRITKEENLTIFLTTSYMDEAERCHRMALMHKGKILAEGTIGEIISSNKDTLIEIYSSDQQKLSGELVKLPTIKTAYQVADKINAFSTVPKMLVNKEIDDIKAFSQKENISIKKINLSEPALEDIFLSKIITGSPAIDRPALEEFFKSDSVKKKADGLMIEVKGLNKHFGKFIAVDNVTFDVKRGEIFGFLGPNGAGKTTTIKMLCGLFPPTSGSGRVAGFNLKDQQWQIKENIGYMSQKFSLYRDLTVSENIELYAGIYGVSQSEVEKRKELILKIADLSGRENSITDSLPMGIKQRLALGCAIIHKPEVIFLDEPTSGVDPVARRIFWEIIFFLSKKMNITVLVTTHYMDEAEQCDRLSLMNQGKLIALGSSADLKDQVTSKIGLMLEVSTDSPFEAFDALRPGFKFINIFGRKIHLYSQDIDTDIPVIERLLKENDIKLFETREKAIPFEDVFVYFCEKK